MNGTGMWEMGLGRQTLGYPSVDIVRRWCGLAIATLLLPLILSAAPALVRESAIALLPTRAHAPNVRAPHHPPVTGVPALPTGIGPLINATLAADDSADYAAVALASPADGLQAANPANQFTTTFGTDAIQIASATSAPWTMHATAISTDGGRLPLAAAAPIASGARVEYRRDGMTEWYVNGPQGLEQGFTLAAPPAGAERFTIDVAISGAVPAQFGDGGILIGGERYSGLAVRDAAGATLPAHLGTTDGAVQIVVDARGAQWPVTVDPFFVAQTLTENDSTGQTDFFGVSVAAAAAAGGTTTVVIGAPLKSGGTGAVYVFTGSAGVFTFQAKLTSSGSSQFGNSVAVAMGSVTTIVVGGGGNAVVFTGSGGSYTEQGALNAPGSGASFGTSVAATTDGTTATIVVGDTSAGSGVGQAYIFAGSGASYPLQATLSDSSGNSSELFGGSVAIASSGGANTVVVGAAQKTISGNFNQGQIIVFTGSGATYSGTPITATDGSFNDEFGNSVAVATAGGTNTIAVGAPGKTGAEFGDGGAYVLIGSGASYTQTALSDSSSTGAEFFGYSVAVGLISGGPIIAVGAVHKNERGASPPLNNNVALFTKNGSGYDQTIAPETGGVAGDQYGFSVAIAAAANGDTTIVGGAPTTPGASGKAVTSFSNYGGVSSVGSIAAGFGDPEGTVVGGNPMTLNAEVLDLSGNDLANEAVTFTLNCTAACGSFTQSGSTTTTHATTQSGDNLGYTTDISVYPNGTAGDFTVTATVDGTTLSTIYHLTNNPHEPVPTISLDNAVVRINPAQDPVISINGTNFDYNDSIVVMKFPGNPTIYSPLTAYYSANKLSATVTAGMLTVGGTVDLYVSNVSPLPGGDIQESNHVTLTVQADVPVDAGTTASVDGNTTLMLSTDPSALPLVSLMGGLPQVGRTQDTTGLIADGTGHLPTSAGGALVSEVGGALKIPATPLLTNDGAGLLTSDGAGVISNDGGSGPSKKPSPTKSATPPSATSKSATPPTGKPGGKASGAAAVHISGDFFGKSDRNGVFGFPAVASNGKTGTYTRSVTIAGISQPITFTFINLNPNDGHPATITSLSKTSATAGDPAFTLTVTGTGFVNGSVISFGGIQRQTTFISATQVSTAITATLLKYPSNLDVRVINPDPNGGSSNTVKFMVVGPALTGVTLAAATANVTVGGTDQVKATCTYADSTTLPCTLAATWSSDNAAVATVNPTNGLVKGVSAGTAKISGTVAGVTGTTTVTVGGSPPPAGGLQFYPLAKPVRLLDTRAGATAFVTPNASLTAGQTLSLPGQFTYQGVTIPASAQAIVGNATVANGSNGTPAGFATIFPSGVPLPLTSNLNFVPGTVRPNDFTVALGSDTKFNLYSSSGGDFVIDISGYYAPVGAGGLYFHPLTAPVRELDTRAGAAAFVHPNATLTAGQTLTLPGPFTFNSITVPAGAKALVGNATVANNANGTPAGFATLYPDDVPLPLASTLNFVPGTVAPNAFTVALGGGDGGYNLYTSSGGDFVIDITGYLDTVAVGGLLFTPLAAPVRELDTRAGASAFVHPNATLTAGQTLTLPGSFTFNGISVPGSAQALVGNATVANDGNSTPAGFATLYPDGVPLPLASNLNFVAKQVAPNAVVVGIGGDGKYDLYTSSGGDFIIDISGYYAAPGGAAPKPATTPAKASVPTATPPATKPTG